MLTALLVLSFAIALTPALTVQARKPVIGTMDLEFNLLWPGPQADIPDWVGTITIDNNEYGMAFFCIGSGKQFAEDPGKVHFFEEIWVIYDYLDFDFVTQELDYGQIILWGYDKGVVSWANSHYVMNGNVEESFGNFAVWQGCNVHMSGVILWQSPGVPQYAPGTFRIN